MLSFVKKSNDPNAAPRTIDPIVFEDASYRSWQYAGMPSFAVSWHPYERMWQAEVSTSAGTRFQGLSPNINEAIGLCMYLLKKYYMWGRDDV